MWFFLFICLRILVSWIHLFHVFNFAAFFIFGVFGHLGKSSQVPQFLLEANLKPILCTQPRRFAVVAVAKTVAKARKCEVGGEVGCHIGHSKNLSAR